MPSASWTGRSWATTAVPFVKDGYLTSVFAASATDAWAVGAVFGKRRDAAVPLGWASLAPAPYARWAYSATHRRARQITGDAAMSPSYQARGQPGPLAWAS
jgi:hypothetical protein